MTYQWTPPQQQPPMQPPGGGGGGGNGLVYALKTVAHNYLLAALAQKC